MDQDVIDVEVTQKQLEAVTNEITSQSKLFEQQREAIDKKKKDVQTLEMKLMQAEAAVKERYNERFNDIDIRMNELSREFSTCLRDKEQLTEAISALHEEADSKSAKVNELRSKWHDINSEKLHLNGELKCPTCHQELPDAKEREVELVANFNTNKANKLKSITETGQQYKEWMDKVYPAELEGLTERIEKVKARILEINKEKSALMEKSQNRESVQDLLARDVNVMGLRKEIEQASKTILSTPDNKALVELEQQREQLIRTMERYSQQQKAIEAKKERMKELKAQEKKLAQELADLERKEFTISRLQANRVNMIEDAVNSQFGMVSFKMFDKQINGGEKQTCETLVMGVPYQDANHAAQINAGIDIINTFSKHIGITAPIWVDNAEAVNQVIKTDSQLIRLVVTEGSLEVY